MNLFVITTEQNIVNLSPSEFEKLVMSGKIREGYDFHISLTEPTKEFITKFSELKGSVHVHYKPMKINLVSSEESHPAFDDVSHCSFSKRIH